jgi:hypothetical protein
LSLFYHRLFFYWYVCVFFGRKVWKNSILHSISKGIYCLNVFNVPFSKYKEITNIISVFVILHQEINRVMSTFQNIDLLGLPQIVVFTRCSVSRALTSRLRLAAPFRISNVTYRCDVRTVQWK